MTVRVGWHPAKTSNFAHGREGRQPIAEVNHRMVGWLLGTRRYFTVSSERPVSTHFGIGHVARDGAGNLRPLCPECGSITGARGPIGIDQYVDLADEAFANGNWDPSGGWPLLRPGVNPNTTTYSIEHEDGGTAGEGVVTAHVRATSVELTRLLRDGSMAEVRAAGIRIGSRAWHDAHDAGATLAAIRDLPLASERFIDHHRIAGRLKPSCWQPWLHDKGYAGGGTQAAKLAVPAPPDPTPRPWPPAHLGTPPVGARGWVGIRGPFFVYRPGPGHTIDGRDPERTAGLSAYTSAPAPYTWAGHGSYSLVQILSGVWRRRWIALRGDAITFHPKP